MTLTRWLTSLAHRRSLMLGLAAGVIGLAAVCLFPTRLSAMSRVIVAWDAGLLVFFVSLWTIMRGQTPEHLRGWAVKLQDSRISVLVFSSVAAAAALATVFVEMKLAKTNHGLIQAARIALVIGTVAASWLFVQTIFALDYAHEYYSAGAKGRDKGGMDFPGGEPPDIWDFLHFAIIIGATAQTADINITTKAVRRLVTVHSLISFSFNTVILALTINLTAGLMS